MQPQLVFILSTESNTSHHRFAPSITLVLTSLRALYTERPLRCVAQIRLSRRSQRDPTRRSRSTTRLDQHQSNLQISICYLVQEHLIYRSTALLEWTDTQHSVFLLPCSKRPGLSKISLAALRRVVTSHRCATTEDARGQDRDTSHQYML